MIVKWRRGEIFEAEKASNLLAASKTKMKGALVIAANRRLIKIQADDLREATQREATDQDREYNDRIEELRQKFAARAADGKLIEDEQGTKLADVGGYAEAKKALDEEFADLLEERREFMRERNELMKEEVEIVLHEMKLDLLPKQLEPAQLGPLFMLVTGTDLPKLEQLEEPKKGSDEDDEDDDGDED